MPRNGTQENNEHEEPQKSTHNFTQGEGQSLVFQRLHSVWSRSKVSSKAQAGLHRILFEPLYTWGPAGYRSGTDTLLTTEESGKELRKLKCA